jgi:hypothetical protein
MRAATCLALALLLSPPAFITTLAQGDGSGTVPSDAVRRDVSPEVRLRRLSVRELRTEFKVLVRRRVDLERDLEGATEEARRARSRARRAETKANLELTVVEIVRRARQ